MARTIRNIQEDMAARMLAEEPGLSTSKVAEWRLWTYVVAAAIYAFEVLLDLFRSEVDEKTSKITPGSATWYHQMCLRFQNGYELKFDTKTALLYYEVDDPDACIIKVAAISESRNSILLKVAKLDAGEIITPLDTEELRNFTGYVEAIKFAGLQTEIMSIPADLIRYDMEVFYDPAIPAVTVERNVKEALAAFRITQSFDAMFYPQKMVEAALAAVGVVTIRLNGVQRKKTTDVVYESVGDMMELWAGYFDYADSAMTMTSVKSADYESEN